MNGYYKKCSYEQSADVLRLIKNPIKGIVNEKISYSTFYVIRDWVRHHGNIAKLYVGQTTCEWIEIELEIL